MCFLSSSASPDWHRILFACTLLFPFSVSAQPTTDQLKIPGTYVTIKLVRIPGGTVRLGETDGPGLRVKMDPFWMSATEITYDQFLPFKEAEFDSDSSLVNDAYSVDAVSRPSPPYLDYTYGMGTRGGFPVVSLTQQAALRYCQWLYEKTGLFLRLPTEAEWEYACRGGVASFREGLEDRAWFSENSNDKYHAVGQKKPNRYGLYDMIGNVAEYTADQFVADFPENLDPTAPHELQTTPKGKYRRAVRGGAYDDPAGSCTCSGRIPSNPAWQARDPQIPKSIWWNPDSPFVGFRIVRPTGEFTEEEVNAYFKKAIVD